MYVYVYVCVNASASVSKLSVTVCFTIFGSGLDTSVFIYASFENVQMCTVQHTYHTCVQHDTFIQLISYCTRVLQALQLLHDVQTFVQSEYFAIG